METAISTIEMVRAEQNDNLSGHVRIGVTEGYDTVMLAPQLAELTRRYPKLGIARGLAGFYSRYRPFLHSKHTELVEHFAGPGT
jgi:DNA-binding transcriptional LysR family regulator